MVDCLLIREITAGENYIDVVLFDSYPLDMRIVGLFVTVTASFLGVFVSHSVSDRLFHVKHQKGRWNRTGPRHGESRWISVGRYDGICWSSEPRSSVRHAVQAGTARTGFTRCGTCFSVVPVAGGYAERSVAGSAQELSCTGSVVMPARVMPGCCVLWLLCCSTLWFQRHNPVRDATRDAAIPLWGFDADRGPRLVSPGDVDLLGEGGSHCIGERLEGAGVWTRSSAILTGRVCALRWWRPSFVWARGHGSQAGLEFRSGTPLPSGPDEVSRETTADG